MIIKLSTLKQADVLSKDGQKLDSIKELLYDASQKTIVGFLTAKKSLLSEAKTIPFTSVVKLSSQTVMIDSKDAAKPVTELGAPFEELAHNEQNMLKKGTIIDENAQQFGSISDVFFDTDTAQVKGFELSNGPLQDAKEGKKTMEIQEIVSVGKDAVIVKPVFGSKDPKPAEPSQSSAQQNVKEKITAMPGKMLKTFSNTAQKATEKVKEQKMQQKPPPPQPSRQKQPVQEPPIEPDPKQVQQAIGQYVAKNILTPSDQLLAKRGQIITHQLMQNAYSAGVLEEILANTSPKPL